MNKVASYLKESAAIRSLEKGLKEAERQSKDTRAIKEMIKRRDKILSVIKKMNKKIIQQTERVDLDPKVNTYVYIRLRAPVDDPITASQITDLKKAGAFDAKKNGDVHIDSFYFR